MPNPGCVGGCGRKVSQYGQICSSCLLNHSEQPLNMVPAPKVESNHDLRMQVWHHAYKLALGNKADREKALSELSHLIVVLQQEKETQ